MDPALILGPYGVVVILVIAVRELYKENKALREASTELLKKYQDRDEEELKALREEARKSKVS